MEPSFDYKRKPELNDYAKEPIQDPYKFSLHKEYEEKIQALKDMYDQRIESITAFAHKFYEVAQTDDVLNVMQGNVVSEKFIKQRMRELFEETMLKECEFTIQNLQTDLSNQKFLASKQASSIKSLEDTLKNEEIKYSKLERDNYEYKNRINTMKNEFEEAVKRRDKEMINKLDEFKTKLFKDEQAKIEKLSKELEKERNKNKKIEDEYRNIKKELENAAEYEKDAKNYRKVLEENEKLKEVCSRLDNDQEKLQKQSSSFEKQLKNILSAEQKASNEALSMLQSKYKSRTKAFKKKILDQKQTIETLDQQLKSYKQGIEDYKKNLEKRSLGTQDDLKKVKEEWEKRCSEIQLEYQRKEAELQTKQQIQLVSLQNQYQSLLEERISEMQREMASSRAKNKDIEFRALLDEKLKDYVPRNEYEEVFKEKEKLLKNHEKFTSQTAAFEKEFEKVIKDRAILEKSLEIERNKIKELEERDDEKKKRIQLEEKLQIVNNSLQQYREILTEKEKMIEELNKKFQEMRTTISTLEFELENERDKSKTLKKDINHLKQELDLTETAKTELENNMIITHSQLELESRRKKNEGIERYEEEATKHIETKTKLIQSEGKLSQALMELEDHQKKIKEFKDTLKNNEQEISKLKKKILEYDNEINIERITSQGLHKKNEKLSKTIFSRLESQQSTKSKLQTLKFALKSLKSSVSEDIQELKKDNSSSIQDLLFRFLDNNNYMRKQLEIRYQTINDEMNEEWIKKIQSLEENINKNVKSTIIQQQEKLSSQEKYIEALKNSAQVLKKEQKSAIDEIEKHKKKINELQDKIQATEKENKALELSLKKNSQAFDTLQADIKKETTKLQQTHEQVLEKQKKDLEKKHSAELQEFLEKYKDKDSQGETFLREKLKEIENLKEEEVFQMKKRYQELLDKAYTDAQSEKEKSSRMKQKIAQIEEEIQILKQEHIKVTSELEERVSFLDKHSKMEIEVLASQLQQVQGKDSKLSKLELEILEKNEEINLLKKDKEKIRAKLRELEEKVEMQNKNFYAQIGIKDKEIESLRTVVSKSYTGTMDEVKRARELDRETQELTKQVRKGISAKNSGYSYSSEISKPI
jgi:hypothetical protein